MGGSEPGQIDCAIGTVEKKLYRPVMIGFLSFWAPAVIRRWNKVGKYSNLAGKKINHQQLRSHNQSFSEYVPLVYSAPHLTQCGEVKANRRQYDFQFSFFSDPSFHPNICRN